MLESEDWRPIPWAERYLVSDLGRVWSTIRHRTLRPRPDKDGYARIHLCVGEHSREASVHRLVLEAFRGPGGPGMVACHNDGDPSNNRLDNLRWDTLSNNQLDATFHLKRRVRCKLSLDDVREFRAAVSAGMSVAEASRRFGITRYHGHDIVSGRYRSKVSPLVNSLS